MTFDALRDGNTVTVMVPMKAGTCEFVFTSFAVSGRKLEGSVLATVKGIDGKWMGGLSQLADVRDGRARDQFARTLKESGLGTTKWSMIVAAAFAAFEAEWRKGAASKVKRASEVVFEESKFVLKPFLEQGVANLLHSIGGVGKTYLALAISAAVTGGTKFLGETPTITGPTLLVDWENSDKDWRRRLETLAEPAAMENFFYINSEGIPMHELADNVAEIVRREGIVLAIIDSAGPACGGKPEEAANATLYFSALRSLGTTTLTIAHEAKNGDGSTPFGSAYFTNLPRNVWSMRKSESGIQAENTKTLELTHRKFNNGPLSPGITFEMRNGLKRMTFEKVDASQKVTLGERVISIIRRDGSSTAAAIAFELTPATRDSVNKTLGRLRANDAIEYYGGKWKLRK